MFDPKNITASEREAIAWALKTLTETFDWDFYRDERVRVLNKWYADNLMVEVDKNLANSGST